MNRFPPLFSYSSPTRNTALLRVLIVVPEQGSQMPPTDFQLTGFRLLTCSFRGFKGLIVQGFDGFERWSEITHKDDENLQQE